MKTLLKKYWQETEAIAAAEAAMIFPILLTLLLGTFDAGYGVLAAQKTIRASQVTADLIARNRTITNADLDSAIEAGRLSLYPFNTDSYGVDITSIEFDDDGNPEQLWCETQNMATSDNVLDKVAPLSAPGEGVVVVTVRYEFEPAFSGFIFHNIPMQETAFVRGRLTSTVKREGGGSC